MGDTLSTILYPDPTKFELEKEAENTEKHTVEGVGGFFLDKSSQYTTVYIHDRHKVIILISRVDRYGDANAAILEIRKEEYEKWKNGPNLNTIQKILNTHNRTVSDHPLIFPTL
jgi:hypothetical protein